MILLYLFQGNADSNAVQLAISTMEGCNLLGMPECEVLLAQCAVYLARAPKSREIDSALAKAKRIIEDWKGAQPSVPMHLRNAPNKLMSELGMECSLFYSYINHMTYILTEIMYKLY